VDLTTGSFKCSEVEGESALLTELGTLTRSRDHYSWRIGATARMLQPGFPMLNCYDDWSSRQKTSQFTLRDHFKVVSLDGFGLRNKTSATGRAGAVLHYLTQHLHRDVAHLTSLSCYQSSDFLIST